MKIKLKFSNIKETIKSIEKYEKSIEVKTKMFLEKLGQIGIEVSSVRFRQAQYDGINDVIVQPLEWVGDDKIIISARGNAVTFIEFGTGVRYTEIHPLATEKGAIRGSYGKGKGKNNSWTYYGSPGTNGKPIRDTDKGTVIRTQGNPPARALYEATKEMKNKIIEIAKEVFK